MKIVGGCLLSLVACLSVAHSASGQAGAPDRLTLRQVNSLVNAGYQFAAYGLDKRKLDSSNYAYELVRSSMADCRFEGLSLFTGGKILPEADLMAVTVPKAQVTKPILDAVAAGHLACMERAVAGNASASRRVGLLEMVDKSTGRALVSRSVADTLGLARQRSEAP